MWKNEKGREFNVMLTWLRRLLAPAPPPPPKLVDLVARVDDLESQLDYLRLDIKKLRGRVTGAERKAEAPESPETHEVHPTPNKTLLANRRAMRGF